MLEDYDHTLLEKYPTSSTRFILARRYFHKKDYKKALEYFGKVHVDHRYYPEALLLTAQVHGSKNDYKLEEVSYTSCQKAAEKEEGKADNVKIKRYYRMKSVLPIRPDDFIRKESTKSLWMLMARFRNNHTSGPILF